MASRSCWEFFVFCLLAWSPFLLGMVSFVCLKGLVYFWVGLLCFWRVSCTCKGVSFTFLVASFAFGELWFVFFFSAGLGYFWEGSRLLFGRYPLLVVGCATLSPKTRLLCGKSRARSVRGHVTFGECLL